MTKSMTAFARTQNNVEHGELVCELRSVNSRFLELHFKLPENFRANEIHYRSMLQKQLTRGKVECHIRFNPAAQKTDDVAIDESHAKSLLAACQKINNLLHQPSEINPVEILQWPGVIKESTLDMKAVFEMCETSLQSAIEDLIANREREGQRMQDLILQRCNSIQEIVDQTRENMPEIQARYQKKLRERLDEINIDVNNDRLEQELVHLAQKMDVDEELDRLDSHLKEINEVLQRDEAIGRRLDFLMQELNREANTLGSKSFDAASTKASVELKVLIEQMREQIQNIE